MAKPDKSPKTTKYPRKLRVKLEKIATARDSRQEWPNDDQPFDPDKVDVHQTFYRSFLPHNSVHAMICRIDEVLERVTMTSHMEEGPFTERVTGPPPWASETGASS